MLPGPKVRLKREAWSQSCTELVAVVRERGQVGPLLGSAFHLSPRPLRGLACLEGGGRAERGGGSCESLESGYGDSTALDTRSLSEFDTLLSGRAPPLPQYTYSCRQSFCATQSYRRHSASKPYRKKDNVVHWKAKCKLELKPLEPVYRDVRVVIPHLECGLSVEYDQFTNVSDVLSQVLSMASPPLDPAHGYSLYHVRLRINLEAGESMVHYQLLPSDVLECRLSVGRMQAIILTVKIPSIHTSRKVKVCLDETVGELISTLMRRVPDPDSSQWAHMSLFLSTKDERGGVWMEDFKFLAAYKLKPTDILELKPKYRPVVFELRVYPHDMTGDHDKPYCSPELLVAQDTLTSEVVELLCNTASLEYDPRFYGLYLHDDSLLPNNVSMWNHLDEVAPAYQDSLVMHMLHKPIEVSFDEDRDSYFCLWVDFSQPCQVTRDVLCRRFGVRHHHKSGLKYEGL
jgi:hypothetical protein